jgi:hypothetical protein
MAASRCKPKSKCAPKAKKAKVVKCAAKTREGKKCKNNAVGKSKFCATHKKK